MIIYKITNKVNNKIYIGQTTKTLEHRKRQHLMCAKNKINRKLYNAMNKYGYENFEFSEICSAKDLDELNYLETYYIVKYDTVRSGYNMGYGGDNNVMFNADTKIKHDEKMRTPQVRDKISKSMKSYREVHPFSKEHRYRLSKAAMGNHNFGTGDTRSIPCYCIDKHDGTRHDFHSYKDAGLWWYRTYKPFGDKYSQCTYQRKIIACIENGWCKFGRLDKVFDDILWYRLE